MLLLPVGILVAEYWDHHRARECERCEVGESAQEDGETHVCCQAGATMGLCGSQRKECYFMSDGIPFLLMCSLARAI